MSAKGSAGAGKIYDYYGNIAGLLCRGPVDALLAITIDSKEEWPGFAAWAAGQSATTSPAFYRRYLGKSWRCVLAHTTSLLNSPPNPVYWVEYFFDRSGADTSDITAIARGLITHEWGTQTQTQDPKLAAAGNSFGEDHPAYLGDMVDILKQVLFGRGRSTVPNITETLRRSANQSIVTGAAANIVDGQCNPVCCFVEVAMNAIHGVGISPSQIDTASFQATADYLYGSNSLTYCSPLLDRQTTLRGFASDLSSLGDTWFRFNSATRKIESGYWIHGAAPSVYTTITIDDLTEKPDITGQGWNSAKTGVVISFSDRERGFKTSSEKYDDPRAVLAVGENRRDSISRPFITRRTQALNHAAEYLRTQGGPRMPATLVVRREKCRLVRPGDWIRFDIDSEPGGPQLLQFFKVVSRSIPRRGPITLTLESDQTLTPVAYNPATDTPAVIPTSDVPEMDQIRFFIAPPRLTGSQGDWMTLLAARPAADVIGANVWFEEADPPVEFSQIATVRSFGVKGTLHTAIAVNDAGPFAVDFGAQIDLEKLGDTITTVQAGDDTLLLILFALNGPSIDEDGNMIPIFEIFSINSITPAGGTLYNFDVKRERQGTSQQNFPVTGDGTEAWVIYRSGLEFFRHDGITRLYNKAIDSDPSTIYSASFVVQPFTAFNQRDFDDCLQYGFALPHGRRGLPTITILDPDWSGNTEPWKEIVSGVGPYSEYLFKVLVEDTDGDLVEVNAFLTYAGSQTDVVLYSKPTEPRSSHYFEVKWTPIPGINTFTISATDKAGNTASQSLIAQVNVVTSVQVPAPVIKSTVTHKVIGNSVPPGYWVAPPTAWKILIPLTGSQIEYQWVALGAALPVGGWHISVVDIFVGLTTGFLQHKAQRLWVKATKSGIADSEVKYYDKYYSNIYD